ncbi:ATP-dependent Clp protease adapter ClpS [candidate division KSB1 bacterium]|nr:ATP-dependent Clp protease adapter ClpS [candidate division KSB1 bacterium]
MGQNHVEYQEGVTTRSEKKLIEPSMYKVILHNDHYTTMDFVVLVLENVFFKSPVEATQIMLNVHKRGFGVCGIYTFEVAEVKVAMVHALAEKHEFPLKCTMEKA